MARPPLHGDELEVALAAADAADALTLPPFLAGGIDVDWKRDRTEVTEIDRMAELAIGDVLVRAHPDHAVVGEEHGVRGDPASPWRWLVDPIDGTSGFVRGIPVWATLIGLTHADHGTVLGVVSAPALGRRWWGGASFDAHAEFGGTVRRVRVSAVDDLTEAQVSVTHSTGWDRLELTGALVELQRRARRSRGFGDFWQHVLVAEGALDVAVDAVGVAPYDLAAVKAIVEGARGTFTDRRGEATHEHDTAISSNGVLHAAVLDVLRTT